MESQAPISSFIRSNVCGLIAIFIALGGTAVALPGKNQVDSGDIRRGQVRTADVARAAITEPKLAAGAVTTSKLAAGAVGADDLAPGSITTAKLATGAVTSTKVADDGLTGEDIDESSLSLPGGAGVPSGPAGGDLSGDFPDPQVEESGLIAGGDLTGPLDLAALTANSLGGQEPGVVANDEIVDQGVDSEDVLDNSLAAADIADAAVGDGEIANVTRSIQIPADQVGEAALLPIEAPNATVVGDFPGLAFNQSTDNNLSLLFTVPDDRDASTPIDVKVHWSGNATGGVVWRVNYLSVTPETGETVSGVPGGGSSLTSTVNVGGNNTLKTAAFNDVLASATVANGDTVALEVGRDADNASDDFGANALLHLVEIEYTAER